MKTAGTGWVAPVGAPSLPMIETVGREAIVTIWGGLGPVNSKTELGHQMSACGRSRKDRQSYLGRRAA